MPQADPLDRARPSVVADLNLAEIEDGLIRALVGIRDDAGDFLLHVDGGQVFDIKGWDAWDWTQGVGLYGLAKIYERTHDDAVLAHIRDWFIRRLAAGAPVKTINTMAPLLTLAYLYEWTGDASYRPILEEWAQWAMNDLPRTDEGGFQHIVIDLVNHQQLWDDTLMMTVMPLAKIGLVLGRPAYVEEAKRQFMLHVKYLSDRVTGLWFHGWTFDGHHHMSAALWARGNSWVTMAIPDLIDLLNLPEDDGLRTFLVETLRRQVLALARTQREDGLWPTLLLEPDTYGEASATAGFTYGILKAVRKGYIGADLRPTGLAALEAVLANIDSQGVLHRVSFGTPIFSTLEDYRRVPLTTMPYGQAMALLALDEAYRLTS